MQTDLTSRLQDTPDTGKHFYFTISEIIGIVISYFSSSPYFQLNMKKIKH